MYHTKQSRRLNCSLDVLPESSDGPIRVSHIDNEDESNHCYELTPKKLGQQSQAFSKCQDQKPLAFSQEKQRQKVNLSRQANQKPQIMGSGLLDAPLRLSLHSRGLLAVNSNANISYVQKSRMSPTKKQKPSIVNTNFPTDFFGSGMSSEIKSRQQSSRKPIRANNQLFKSPDCTQMARLRDNYEHTNSLEQIQHGFPVDKVADYSLTVPKQKKELQVSARLCSPSQANSGDDLERVEMTQMESLENISMVHKNSLRIHYQISVHRLSGELQPSSHQHWTEQQTGKTESLRMPTAFNAGSIPKIDPCSSGTAHTSQTTGLPALRTRQGGAPSTSSRCIRAMHGAQIQLKNEPKNRYFSTSQKRSEAQDVEQSSVLKGDSEPRNFETSDPSAFLRQLAGLKRNSSRSSRNSIKGNQQNSHHIAQTLFTLDMSAAEGPSVAGFQSLRNPGLPHDYFNQTDSREMLSTPIGVSELKHRQEVVTATGGPTLQPVRCSRLIKARLSGDQYANTKTRGIKLPSIAHSVQKSEIKRRKGPEDNLSSKFKSFDSKPKSFLDKFNQQVKANQLRPLAQHSASKRKAAQQAQVGASEKATEQTQVLISSKINDYISLQALEANKQSDNTPGKVQQNRFDVKRVSHKRSQTAMNSSEAITNYSDPADSMQMLTFYKVDGSSSQEKTSSAAQIKRQTYSPGKAEQSYFVAVQAAAGVEIETPSFKDPSSTMRRHNSSVLSSLAAAYPGPSRFTDQNYQTATFNMREHCESDNTTIVSESVESTTSLRQNGTRDETCATNSHSLEDLLSISRSLPKSAIDAFFNLQSPTGSTTQTKLLKVVNDTD